MATKPKAQRVISRADALEGGEPAEIAAEVTLPVDGGWGWAVVISSFLNIFILDGVVYTFGSLLQDMSKDLNHKDSIVALSNSIAVSMYFLASPLAAALINRYGFRECAMAGSVVCSFSLLISYFTTVFGTLCIFYGFLAGFGYCLINMSSGLVVGFYFERLRSLALGIATCGSSVGIMLLFPLNSELVRIADWRSTTLLHSGLVGLIFFLSMSFRPLLSIRVTRTDEQSTCTVTYLPSLASGVRTAQDGRASQSTTRSTQSAVSTTATERLFSAVSSSHFPTAAKIVEESSEERKYQDSGKKTSEVDDPTTGTVSNLTLITHQPPNGALSTQQLKQMQNIVLKTSPSQMKRSIQKSKPRRFWKRFFHWESHVPESRPMYRDDAFYKGRLEDLPVYQKSVIELPKERRTGLEYALAVSRAATVVELGEKRGVFTTAARRILATMMDPNLFRKKTFILLCSSGFFNYLGFLVPYVYIKDRNIQAGVDPQHCTFLISAMSLSNAFGRLGLGTLSSKIDPVVLFSFSLVMAGIVTVVSCFSFNLYYQYACCCIFGFFISSVAVLRSVILVSLYGLDKLTNATGMMLIFLGLGNLLSTPIAGLIKDKYGYKIAFYVAGIFITIGGILLIPINYLPKKFNKKKKTVLNSSPQTVNSTAAKQVAQLRQTSTNSQKS